MPIFGGIVQLMFLQFDRRLIRSDWNRKKLKEFLESSIYSMRIGDDVLEVPAPVAEVGLI